MKVSFKISRSFTLEVSSADTIGSIKEKICRIEGASINQQELFFDGNHLEDSKTLSDYFISTDCTIDVVERRMPISIKIPSMEKTLVLNVNYMDTVQKLKAMIQDELGIIPDQQLLILCGNSLKDDQLLISCGIIKDSIIYVLLNPLAALLLYVHIYDGDTFSLEVIAGYTIWDVKLIVESLKGIPVNQQKKFLDNVELQDSFTLSFYKIKHRSVLHLQVPMQIFVELVNGKRKTITITAEPSDTIAVILTKIVSKMGFKSQDLSRDFRLLYAGKMLQLQETIDYYEIERESTIFLLVSSSYSSSLLE